jgi:hypothetical protein
MPYRPFDPNTDDYIAMVRAGIPAKVAGNIIAYRSKGVNLLLPKTFLYIWYGFRFVYEDKIAD